jgi:hypothetical protein
MAHTVKRIEGAVKSMRFTCDHPGCTAGHDDTEIMAGGGLRNMGWLASGGRHFCPVHKDSAGG